MSTTQERLFRRGGVLYKVAGIGGTGWVESEHPRDRLGRFIETGAEVRVWGGIGGTVVRNVGGGRIEIERNTDHQHVIVHRNYLTVISNADGSAPTDKADQVSNLPEQDASPDAVEEATPETPDVNTADLGEQVAAGVRDKEVAGEVRRASAAYQEAVSNNVPDDEADERAALLTALSKADQAGAEPAAVDSLREAATDEPTNAPQAPASGRVDGGPTEPPRATVVNPPGSQRLVDKPDPNATGTLKDGTPVKVGDQVQAPNRTGQVVGFTPAGGVIMRDSDGNDWPYKPDANVTRSHESVDSQNLGVGDTVSTPDGDRTVAAVQRNRDRSHTVRDDQGNEIKPGDDGKHKRPVNKPVDARPQGEDVKPTEIKPGDRIAVRDGSAVVTAVHGPNGPRDAYEFEVQPDPGSGQTKPYVGASADGNQTVRRVSKGEGKPGAMRPGTPEAEALFGAGAEEMRRQRDAERPAQRPQEMLRGATPEAPNGLKPGQVIVDDRGNMVRLASVGRQNVSLVGTDGHADNHPITAHVSAEDILGRYRPATDEETARFEGKPEGGDDKVVVPTVESLIDAAGGLGRDKNQWYRIDWDDERDNPEGEYGSNPAKGRPIQVRAANQPASDMPHPDDVRIHWTNDQGGTGESDLPKGTRLVPMDPPAEVTHPVTGEVTQNAPAATPAAPATPERVTIADIKPGDVLNTGAGNSITVAEIGVQKGRVGQTAGGGNNTPDTSVIVGVDAQGNVRKLPGVTPRTRLRRSGSGDVPTLPERKIEKVKPAGLRPGDRIDTPYGDAVVVRVRSGEGNTGQSSDVYLDALDGSGLTSTRYRDSQNVNVTGHGEPVNPDFEAVLDAADERYKGHESDLYYDEVVSEVQRERRSGGTAPDAPAAAPSSAPSAPVAGGRKTTSKGTLYTVTHGDGTTSTRTSKRPYTHAIVVEPATPEARKRAYERRADEAEARAARYDAAADAGKVVKVDRGVARYSNDPFGDYDWSLAGTDEPFTHYNRGRRGPTHYNAINTRGTGDGESHLYTVPEGVSVIREDPGEYAGSKDRVVVSTREYLIQHARDVAEGLREEAAKLRQEANEPDDATPHVARWSSSRDLASKATTEFDYEASNYGRSIRVVPIDAADEPVTPPPVPEGGDVTPEPQASLRDALQGGFGETANENQARIYAEATETALNSWVSNNRSRIGNEAVTALQDAGIYSDFGTPPADALFPPADSPRQSLRDYIAQDIANKSGLRLNLANDRDTIEQRAGAQADAAMAALDQYLDTNLPGAADGMGIKQKAGAYDPSLDRPGKGVARPEGEVVRDPVGGAFPKHYVRQTQGKVEYRRYEDGSVTIIDTSKPSGTNRTIGHTGPNRDKAFDIDVEPGTGGDQPSPDASIEDRPSEPITIAYVRNPVSSTANQTNQDFGQDVEPAGRYLSDSGGAAPLPGWESGNAHFEKPLNMDFGGGYAEDSNWKRRLSAHYDGKTGKELSDAVRADGYDAIITHDKYGHSEIVDLSNGEADRRAGSTGGATGGAEGGGTGGATGAVIDSVNPSSSGVFEDYASGREFRATAPLADNMTTLAETEGEDPDADVTLYRGVPADEPGGIQPGDFVTTNRQLAQDYAGSGRVEQITGKYGDVLDDRDEPGGEEYIYRPAAAGGDTGGAPTGGDLTWEQVKDKYPAYAAYGMDHAVNELAHISDGEMVTPDLRFTEETVDLRDVRFQRYDDDDERAAALRDGYQNGEPVPPVLLVARAGNLYTVDGHHRLSVQEASGQTQVRAVVAHSVRDDEYSGNVSDAALGHTSRGKVTEATPEELQRARDLGRAAYDANESRAPAANAEIMQMVGDAEVGNPRSTAIMRAFSAGHQSRGDEEAAAIVAPDIEGRARHADDATADQPDKPTNVVGTAADDLEVGDRAVLDDGTVLTITGKTRSADTVSLDYETVDGERGTLDADRASVLQKVDNGTKAPIPEPEENPRDTSADSQIRGEDLRAGSRVWLGGRKATIKSNEPYEDMRLVTIQWPDRTTETLPFGNDAVIDSAEDMHLPDPSPLPDDVQTSRPVLYTYQRRNIVALGLDNNDDPMVAEAARRIRMRQPLAAEHSRALSQHLVEAAGVPGVKPQRQRMLLRLAAANNAAAIEAGGRGVDMPEMPNARTVTRTRPEDFTVGDNIVFAGANGEIVQGKLTNVRRMMGGRLTQVTYTDSDGIEHTHLLSRGTQSYLMPDLPDDKPVPKPQAGRELVSHEDIKVGDKIEVHLNFVGEDGRPELRRTEVTVTAVGREDDSSYIETDAQNQAPGAFKRLYKSPGDMDIIRTSRGPNSLDQPRTMDLPDFNPTVIKRDEVKVGDWVSIPQRWGSGPTGSSVEGVVLDIEQLTGENADGSPVDGQNFLIRTTSGGTNRVAVFGEPEDDRFPNDPAWWKGAVITRLMADDQNTPMRIAEAKERRARAMEVHAHAAVFGGAIGQMNRDAVWPVGRAIDADGYEVSDSALENMIHLGFQSISRDALGDRGQVNQLATSIAIRMSGQSSGDRYEALREQAKQIARQHLGEHLNNMRDALLGARPTEPGQSRQQAAKAMLLAIRDGDVEVPMRNLEAIGRSMADARKALDATETADVSGGIPSLPDLPEGADLETRVKAYKDAIGGVFGGSATQVATYDKFTLDDLEQGRIPEIKTTVIAKTASAADGGPGETAMAHLDIVRAAGRDLDVELAREMAKFDPDLPPDAQAEQMRLQLQVKELQKRNLDSSRDLRRELPQAKDAAAQNLGYKNTLDFEGAYNRAFSRFSAIYSFDRENQVRIDAEAEFEKVKRDKLQIEDVIFKDDRIKFLREEVDRTRESYLTISQHQQRMASRIAEARGEAARRVLARAREMGGTGKTLEYRQGGSGKKAGGAVTERSKLVQAMRYAETNYPSDWLNLVKARGSIGLNKTSRGNYKSWKRDIALSDDWGMVPKGVPPHGRVATHELGHEMERAIPGLFESERALLWSRTSEGEIGSRKRQRTGTTDGSATYANEFPEKYTGKDYGRDALEVFTTAAESLFAGSPYLDDDLRQWILGTMALL